MMDAGALGCHPALYRNLPQMASEAERLLKGSGWLPEVLRRNDLVALDGEDRAEGQGADAEVADSVSEAALPAFLTDDLPAQGASMLAAE